MSTEIVTLNIDTVIAMMEVRPESRARANAWEWLAEQTAATFDGDALLVPSRTWSDTTYRATPSACTCQARAHCWHMEAAQIIADARAEDAYYDAQAAYAEALPFDLADDLASFAPSKKERKAQAYAEMAELFA